MYIHLYVSWGFGKYFLSPEADKNQCKKQEQKLGFIQFLDLHLKYLHRFRHEDLVCICSTREIMLIFLNLVAILDFSKPSMMRDTHHTGPYRQIIKREKKTISGKTNLGLGSARLQVLTLNLYIQLSLMTIYGLFCQKQPCWQPYWIKTVSKAHIIVSIVFPDPENIGFDIKFIVLAIFYQP